MSVFLLALAQATESPVAFDSGLTRAFIGLAAVLALISVLAWLLRRGVIKLPGQGAKGSLALDGTLQLGERRSVVVVQVEGRRLVLGVTATQINLLAELGDKRPAFDRALDRASSPSPVTPS